MKLFKRFSLTVIIMCSTAMLSGCVYSNNKSWDHMSDREKQEARQVFEEIKEDLEKGCSDDYITDEFASYILNRVEKAMNRMD